MKLSSTQTHSFEDDPDDPSSAGLDLLLNRIITSTEDAKVELGKLRSVRIRHSMFYNMFNQLANQAQFAPPGHPIFVIGPTGAGKTTLALVFLEQLIAHFQAKGLFEGQIAYFYMDLKLEHSKEFIWRRFYMGALRELGEPMLDKKVNLKKELQKLREAGIALKPYALNDQDIGDLRDCLEHQLKIRGTHYCLIDEANLLAMTKSTKSDMKSQMEVLKSLAASVPTTRFIFFATSDALPLLHLSPQLSRRVKVLQFKPYGTSQEELKALGNGLLPYLNAVPRGFNFKLNSRIRTIRDTTSGLFGATAEWVQRAAVPAILEKRPINWEDMESTKPDYLTMDSLRRDVEQYSSYFSEKQTPTIESPSSNDSTPGRPGRRPGKRNPKRDKKQS